MRRKSNQRKNSTGSTKPSLSDKYQTQYKDICKVSSKFTQLNPRFNQKYYRSSSNSRRSLSRDSFLVNSQESLEREDINSYTLEAKVNCPKKLFMEQNLSAVISRTFFE